MNDTNQAIVLYIGFGISPYPKEDYSRILNKFGNVTGVGLADQVRSLIEELQQIQPDWDSYDLVGASKWAVSELSLRHQFLNDEAKSALEWLYSWWWK